MGSKKFEIFVDQISALEHSLGVTSMALRGTPGPACTSFTPKCLNTPTYKMAVKLSRAHRAVAGIKQDGARKGLGNGRRPDKQCLPCLFSEWAPLGRQRQEVPDQQRGSWERLPRDGPGLPVPHEKLGWDSGVPAT